MDIVVLSSEKNLFLVISTTGDGEYEGVVCPTGRECEGEAMKITNHIASTIMYCLIFDLDTHPDKIIEFI